MGFGLDVDSAVPQSLSDFVSDMERRWQLEQQIQGRVDD